MEVLEGSSGEWGGEGCGAAATAAREDEMGKETEKRRSDGREQREEKEHTGKEYERRRREGRNEVRGGGGQPQWCVLWRAGPCRGARARGGFTSVVPLLDDAAPLRHEASP